MSTASPATTPHDQSDDDASNGDAILEQLARRVDEAIAEIQTLPREIQSKAMALRSAIEEFHKVGLTLIVKRLKGDPRGKELLFELVDHPAVYALFSMHGIVRADLTSQVSRVLDMVRPYMKSHGGDVILEEVRGKTVYVRLVGNCQGCSMSSLTLRNTVEESLKQNLPEIEAVKVVSDVDSQPATAHAASANPDQENKPLVQIQLPKSVPDQTSPSSDAAGLMTPGHGWIAGPLVAELDPVRPAEFVADEVKVLLVPTHDGWRAYRNACAHQGLPLDSGLLDMDNDTLVCPWHGFQFSASSGECMSAPQCQLEPFPLRILEGRVWVRPV